MLLAESRAVSIKLLARSCCCCCCGPLLLDYQPIYDVCCWGVNSQFMSKKLAWRKSIKSGKSRKLKVFLNLTDPVHPQPKSPLHLYLLSARSITDQNRHHCHEASSCLVAYYHITTLQYLPHYNIRSTIRSNPRNEPSKASTPPHNLSRIPWTRRSPSTFLGPLNTVQPHNDDGAIGSRPEKASTTIRC